MKAANDKLSVAIRAIADPSRRKILNMLSRSKDVTASDIEERVKLAQPTVSHHMKVLVRAKLVTLQRQGTWVYYERDESTIKHLKEEAREL